jgi:hypothetical protein
LFDDIPEARPAAHLGLFDDIPEVSPVARAASIEPRLAAFLAKNPQLPTSHAAVASPSMVETPAEDAPAMSWKDYADAVLQKAAAGATFNYADEIAAIMGSAGNTAMRGLGIDIPEKSYRSILNELHGQEKQFEKSHPKTALTAEIAGALTPGGARFILNAPRWSGRALRSGMVAAPYGAASETGRLEKPPERDLTFGDYASAAGEGAAKSAAAGAVLSGAGSARLAPPWVLGRTQRLNGLGIAVFRSRSAS